MSIRHKIIFSFLAVALLIGLLGSLTFYRDIDEAEDVAQHEAAALAKTISLFITMNLQTTGASSLNEMNVELQRLISGFKKTHDRDIVVTDMQKLILADAVPSEIGTAFQHDGGNEVGLTLRDGIPRTFVEMSEAYPQGIRVMVLPIELSSGNRIGALVMEYTPLYEEMLAATKHKAGNFLRVFLFALILSLLIGFAIAESISTPLKEMTNAAIRLSSGDLNTRVVYKSRDELGSLADNFNTMAEELKSRMDQIRTLINAIPDMAYFKDADGRHVVVNRAFSKFTGITEQDAAGKTNEELFPPDLAEACRRSDATVMKGQEVVYLEETMMKDGKESCFETFKVPIYSDKGVCTGLVGISRDVTEHKKSESVLRASEAKLRLLFDSASDAVFIIGPGGRFMDVNKTGHERLGYTKQEMLSMTVAQIDPPEYAVRVPERLARIRERGYAVFESAHVRKNGTVMPVEVNARLLELDGIQVYFSVVRDITERKQAEDIIRAALTEKEILLKEVHHRVKNNLQVIASMLQLQAGYIADDRDRTFFDESQKRVETMSLIHEKLYRAKDLARIDFRDYVEDLVANLLTLHTGRADQIELQLDIEGVELDVNNSIPCGLIINELVSNSLKHAFPAGKSGRISIGMRSADNGAVTLSVRDDGAGFPEQLDFRSTRSLGLQLVISLVAQLEGEIELESCKGTCFTIRFAP